MPSPNVNQLLAHPQIRAAIERSLASRGVHGDTIIAHLDPREAAMLKMMGGVGTVNPRTGLRQFYGGNADPDAGGVGGSAGRGMGDSSGGGTNPGGLGGGVGGALGRALSDIGGFVDRAAGNFGSGWGSRGVAGGYGAAGNQSGAGYAGGGAGGGGLSGGHSGQNYISQQFGVNPTGIAPRPVAPLPAAPVISNMPQAPVSLTPMMSSTATTDLAGGERFGALPSWATQPYQVGTAPSAYPTPGVNAGLGAPGFVGNPLPGQGGGGGLPPGRGVGGSGNLPRLPMGGGGGLLGGGGSQGPFGGTNQFGPNSSLTVPQQMVLAKQLRLSPGALDRLTATLPAAVPAALRAVRASPGAINRLLTPALGISQAAYQRLTPQQKASWAASQGQSAPAALPGPVMGQTAKPAPPSPSASARQAAAPQPPVAAPKQPATMTAAAKAAAAAKAKAAAAAKARSAARTGGKNFG